jgi:hypothetical protein
MTTRPKPDATFVKTQAVRMRELLQERRDLPREDLEYLVEHIGALKDERLKSCVASLIGWGDDDRAEVETFVAIALEVMGKTTITRIRQAAMTVQLRQLERDL